nr:transposase [Ferrovum sp.]
MNKTSTAKDVSVRTLRCRVKDKHAKVLSGLAREVNLVWNYCNELSLKVWERERRFIGESELQKYLTGATKAGLSLHSQTVQAIAQEFVARRRQFKKVRLSWRKSGGSRRSLGWIPFKASAVEYKGGAVRYGKIMLNLWDSYDLSRYDLGTGTLSEDSRGRWYFNVTVKVKARTAPVHSVMSVLNREVPSVGIDLGLKEFLSTSDGIKVSAKQFYRALEPSLAIAQRAGHNRRVKAIHAKIKNRRHDHLHKLSRNLVNRSAAIFVGNVNSSALTKTRMAKSVLDAGWSQFRTMLQYKCADAGAWFEEVNEAYSTQTCSTCGALPRSRPQGIAGLGIREWTCCACGATHDRDINAARNILALGHERLAAGISFL